MIHLLPLVLFSQGAFAPVNHKPLPASSDDFVFVALGDNRPAGMGLPPTVSFREILKEIALIGPAFALSSGDLYYGNDESLEAYKQEMAWTQPLLDALPFPFYNAPGNHEMAKPEFAAAYTSAFGKSYGSFEYGGLRFVAVSTDLSNVKAGVSGDQLTWLKGVLSEPKPTVVFQHHPVFARQTNEEKDGSTVENAADLHKLYKDGGAKLVLEGHDHVYNAQTHDGIAYTIAGGAGAPLDADPLEGGFFHFLLVEVEDGKIKQTPLPLGAVEATQLKPGVAAVANYANTDLPINNLWIESDQEPKGVTGAATNHGKTKSVDVTLVQSVKTNIGFLAQVKLKAPKHRATVVTLTY